MKSIQLIKGEFGQPLDLLIAPAIKAGFPSPAEDYLRESLDCNRDLIAHPEATFYGRVDGDSMKDAGINDGDIAVIDRSVEPRDGDVVVGYVNGKFTAGMGIQRGGAGHNERKWDALPKKTERCIPLPVSLSGTAA